MTKPLKKDAAQLPQSSDSWYFAARQLHLWISPENKKPYRPHLLVILSQDSGLILGFNITPKPTAEEARKLLFSVMAQPKKEFRIKPQRPAKVDFEDQNLMVRVTPDLKGIGIQTKYVPQPEIADELVKELESHMRGGEPEIPGLLAQKKVTPELVGDFFAAAADFYRAAPWVQLSNEDVLAVRLPHQKEYYYLTVLGQGGVEYGLGMYKSWQDVERMYRPHDHPDEIIPPGGAHNLLFDDASFVPFPDLDDIQQYDWEIADNQAYPVPMIYFRSGNIKRPNREEILWYTAALRALPTFIRQHIEADKQDNPIPSEATISVTLSHEQVNVEFKYPAGELPKRHGSPVWEEDEEEEQGMPSFDRRAMEGGLADLLEFMDEGEVDPDLKKAQQLMYQAWDEDNPAKRLALARQALKISSNCADAYVMLAEEEADSVESAHDYYRQGVEAGEQALGKDYFEENAGHFWGLLETRPYMRALEGLAQTTWKLGQKEEAVRLYQEILRLNPGDNQGIRYMLVELLLTMNQDREVQQLLTQYKGDWSAVWTYTRALLIFRKEGATAHANRALQKALGQNPHVLTYLTGKKRIPHRLPDYIGIGDEREAIHYAADHLNHWRRTPGAVEWLKKQKNTV